MPELDEKNVRRNAAVQRVTAPRSARVTPVAQKTRPVAAVQAGPVRPPADFQDANPLRRFALFAGLGLTFTMFATLPELLAYILHINTYVLYIFGPATIVGIMVTGGIGRTLQHRAAIYWMAFFILMLLATPFSSWVGGSVTRDLDFARYSLPLLFVAGGLALTWDEVRKYFYVIGAAAFLEVMASRLFAGGDNEGRLTLNSSGTIGDSNDLASHLVIVLPFLAYIATDPRRKALVRYPLLAVIGYGAWVILDTGSRGGLVSLGVVFVFVLWRASATQRLMVLIAGIVLVIAVPLMLPGSIRARLGSLFGGGAASSTAEEAEESADSRSYLFRQSVIFTVQHPIFGVGPDQFSNFEGKTRMSEGEHGNWHATHCAFTQISSECGIPALICFLLAIGSAGLTVNRTWKRARKQRFPEISRGCFCYMTALMGYLASITFLANAYRFYLPAMIGLGIVIGRAGNRFMDEHARAVHS